jgi:hypothetical protein
MRRFAVLGLLGCCFAVDTAAAGGWWASVQVERRTVAIGQRVVARAEAWFPSAAAAQEAHKTEFYAYLLTDLDRRMLDRAMAERNPRGWWSLGAADAIRIGRVVLGNTSTNLPGARASFRMPDVAPDTYALMFCDAGCRHPLANTVPLTRFTVAADPITARLAIRVDETASRLYKTAAQLAATRRKTEADRTRTAARITQLVEDNSRLESQLRALEHAPGLSPWGSTMWLAVAALLAGPAAALLLSRRASQQARRPSPDPARGGPPSHRPETELSLHPRRASRPPQRPRSFPKRSSPPPRAPTLGR